MEIIWSNISKRDLRNFFDHIHEGTETTVTNYILNLINYTDFLSNNPYLGKVLFSHNNLDYRILIYRKHKILYTVTNNINIVSLIHSSRNMEEILNQLKSLDLYL